MRRILMVWALVAAWAFACITPGTKLLLAQVPPQILAGIFYLSAGVGLLVVLLLRQQVRDSWIAFSRKDLIWLFAATLFGGLLGPLFLTFGVGGLRGTTATLLLNLEAVLTSALAWLVFSEKFSFRIFWGMVLIVLGGVALAFGSLTTGGEDTLLGLLLVSAACLSWGIDNNVTRKISHLPVLAIASTKGVVAGVVNLSIGWQRGEAIPTLVAFGQAALIGFVGIGLSLVAFILALRKIGAARTGAIFSTSPFLGAALSWIFLGEAVGASFFFAALLMAAGVALFVSESN